MRCYCKCGRYFIGRAKLVEHVKAKDDWQCHAEVSQGRGKRIAKKAKGA